jgi:hypothetical protein
MIVIFMDFTYARYERSIVDLINAKVFYLNWFKFFIIKFKNDIVL